MPNPNITEFISQFNGGARANRFDVMLTFPSGVPNEMEKLSFSCKAASMPQSDVASVDVAYMSRVIKVAGDRTIADWTVTVINDSDFNVRRAFEVWLNRINAHENNVSASGWNDPKNYYATAEVTQFDREHTPIKRYKMMGIFPIAMSEIALTWDQASAVEEFTVNFAVNWWESDTTS